MHVPLKTCGNLAEPGQVAQYSADSTWRATWHQWTRGDLLFPVLVTALSFLCGGLQLDLHVAVGNTSNTDQLLQA